MFIEILTPQISLFIPVIERPDALLAQLVCHSVYVRAILTRE
jgi:hypothetical protein